MLGNPRQRRDLLLEALRPTRELSAQHTVHHKVRVSANGAGEMRICRAGQAVMPFALRFVARALHSAQHERLHKIGFKPPPAFRQHLLHDMRITGNEPLRADAVEPTELRKHGKQGGKAIRRGLFVHSIQGGEITLVQMRSHHLVG